MSNLNVLPDDIYGNKMLKAYKKIKVEKVKVIAIDYSILQSSILKAFLDYIENYENNKDWKGNKKILISLLKNISFEVKTDTYLEIAKTIKKIDNSTLNNVDSDLIEYRSINHLQNIDKPFFWNSVEQNGFYCENNNKIKIKFQNKKIDVNFFYSLSSLLFYEIAQSLKKSKRCLNCGQLLPSNHQGKYCSNKNKKCQAERNRNKQRKHASKIKQLTKA